MLKKLTAAGIAAAAAALLTTSPAHAGMDTDGSGGILSGNQVVAPVSIPVSICGDSVAIIGISRAGCRGGASVGAGHYHRGYYRPWDY